MNRIWEGKRRWWSSGGTLLAGCSMVTAPYKVTIAVKAGIWMVTTTYKMTAGATKTIYKVGKFTYEVTRAPTGWAFTRY
ncbi:MAG: hypothetical protein P8130_10980 [Deltaproteobacteria bacterium]